MAGLFATRADPHPAPRDTAQSNGPCTLYRLRPPPMTPPSPKPAIDPRTVKALAFEDLHVGMREVLMKTVMDSDIVGFARISGDENPIHLCDVYAAQTRFGQRIAHGLYTASLISAVLGTQLPGPGAVYRSQTLNFHAPVKIGDVVTVIVEVVELVAEGRKARLSCEALVDGRVVLDGEAIVTVPGRRQFAQKVAG